ncbi:hypothetical protein Desku_0798 [Desulfofundulus kuznetsovii DSM 6115]|uniref:Uncharacterized protein n=1 Tax=Desulfofundulus kuznetsovii (strain DSM 6115 / VKM B-1805 / 17) TaxID=760568 RepID=A0AAU8P941_DESK7|nr:hypothetical protein Desku_0798 [Desulfofundulus kuznetsovii DSM 6115]
MIDVVNFPGPTVVVLQQEALDVLLSRTHSPYELHDLTSCHDVLNLCFMHNCIEDSPVPVPIKTKSLKPKAYSTLACYKILFFVL